MSDLFEIKPSYPPALMRARERYAAAQAAYEKADAHEDDSGEAIPKSIEWERQDAFRALEREEKHELWNKQDT